MEPHDVIRSTIWIGRVSISRYQLDSEFRLRIEDRSGRGVQISITRLMPYARRRSDAEPH